MTYAVNIDAKYHRGPNDRQPSRASATRYWLCSLCRSGAQGDPGVPGVRGVMKKVADSFEELMCTLKPISAFW